MMMMMMIETGNSLISNLESVFGYPAGTIQHNLIEQLSYMRGGANYSSSRILFKLMRNPSSRLILAKGILIILSIVMFTWLISQTLRLRMKKMKKKKKR